MEAGSHLKYLLQNQLASDSSAARYLPYCLSTLNPECFLPSSHLVKYTTRIHALIHSKESGARWAGLCLAYKTALLSPRVMVDMAQSWITVVMPLLSRNEPVPILKAAIRLLRTIFTTATNIPEFQRQVSAPNVLKFTPLVVSVAENPDNELKVMCMETLADIIIEYPTAHRASSASLSAFALRHLNGSSMGPTNQEVLNAASRLYAVLPLTGGKVGATNMWRKSVDETLTFGWEALYSLRTTFPFGGPNAVPPVPSHEPQIAIPLNHDRLRCSVVVLRSLLGTVIQRPVQVPLGNIIKYIFGLLSCSTDEAIDGFFDPSVRSMEVSVVPDIWKFGCDLLIAVTEQFPYRLDPYCGRLFTLLAFQLDQKQPAGHKLCCLRAVDALLRNCHPVDSSTIPTRLSKAVLPSITNILSSPTDKDNQPSSSKSKNARKRARNYEGDEVFKVTREVSYRTAEEGEIALVSLDVVHTLFKNPTLSSTMQSIIARVIVSLLMALPRIPWSTLSQDPTLAQRLVEKVQEISFTIGAGTTGVMSKTLPFVIKAALSNNMLETQRDLGILLHPRVPPIVRTMPHVESLSLFKAEESQEEADTLRALKMADVHNHPTTEPTEDIIMDDHSVTKKPHDSNLDIPSPNLSTGVKHDALENKPPLPTINAKEAALTQVVESNQKNDDERPNKSTLATDVPSEPKVLNPITYPSVTMPVEDDDEDEEMPAIDPDSDSEVDED